MPEFSRIHARENDRVQTVYLQKVPSSKMGRENHTCRNDLDHSDNMDEVKFTPMNIDENGMDHAKLD